MNNRSKKSSGNGTSMAAAARLGKADAVMNSADIDAFRNDLLGWYDTHARDLPWRARPGQRPNPYHVWLSEIMLQQTVVATVIPYFQKFVDKWPTLRDLAAAPEEEIMDAWAGLGYYARARNLHACARQVAAFDSAAFPEDDAALQELPGIGPYTGAAISAIAFDRSATVVDGNVDRVIARYFCITAPLPPAKAEIRRHASLLAAGRRDRPGDFAQAMMDLGATVCTPQNPRCGLCPLFANCRGRREGLAGVLPYKRKKAGKPLKAGFVYWIENEEGNILFERRPKRGLLGGMNGLPTGVWKTVTAGAKSALPPHPAGLRIEDSILTAGMRISHSFTHFDLQLDCLRAAIEPDGNFMELAAYFWGRPDGPEALGLPTVFRKMTDLINSAVRQAGLRSEIQ